MLGKRHETVIVAAKMGVSVVRGSKFAKSRSVEEVLEVLWARDEVASLPNPLITRSRSTEGPDRLTDLGTQVWEIMRSEIAKRDDERNGESR